MAYTKTAWTDRQVQRPLTFTQVTNSDGTITLLPAEGTIIQAGTPITANNLNNIETQYDQAMIDIKASNYLTPTLYNGWAMNGTGVTQFYKDADNVVHYEFCIGNGAVGANNAFIILPVGYRPNARIVRTGYCDITSTTNTGFIYTIDPVTGNMQPVRDLPSNGLIVGYGSFKAVN